MDDLREKAKRIRRGFGLASIGHDLVELARELGIVNVRDLNDEDLVALWELRQNRLRAQA